MDASKIRMFRSSQIETRLVDEFVGIARGMSADGEINEKEAEYLYSWATAIQSENSSPLMINIFDRLNEMAKDGEFDPDERKELLELLQRFVGEPIETGEFLKSSTIPFSKPEPKLEFFGMNFVLTGNFIFERRSDIAILIGEWGGKVKNNISSQTHFLIVGEYASENWVHSNYGRKIEQAVRLRDEGHNVHICSEGHLKRTLDNMEAMLV